VNSAARAALVAADDQSGRGDTAGGVEFRMLVVVM